MDTKTAFTSAWAGLCAAMAACTLFTGDAAAKDPEVTVAYQVSTQGLDLNEPLGARKLYSRLEHAADVVCAHGMRVDLAPPLEPKGLLRAGARPSGPVRQTAPAHAGLPRDSYAAGSRGVRDRHASAIGVEVSTPPDGGFDSAITS